MTTDILRVIGGGLLALVAAYIGICIKRYYKKRETFFADAQNFVTSLKSEIAFRKTPLPTFIDAYEEEHKSPFGKFMKTRFDNLKSGDAQKPNNAVVKKEDETESLPFLKSGETLALKNFLEDLGKTDVADQIALVQRAAEEFGTRAKKCAEETKKLGDMYFRLSVVAGIALMLIVV